MRNSITSSHSSSPSEVIIHPAYFAELEALRTHRTQLQNSIQEYVERGAVFCASQMSIASHISRRIRELQEGVLLWVTKAQDQLQNIGKAKKLSRSDARNLKDLSLQLEQLAHEMRSNASEIPDFEELMENLRQARRANENRTETSDKSDDGKQQDYFSTDDDTTKTDPDQRNIALRSIYLQLSKKFHPDRAQDEEQRKFFHNVMQDINSYYARGDIPGLLHLSRTFSDALPSSVSSSTLNAELELLKNEIKELKKALKRAKNEYGELRRQSPDPKAVDKFAKGKIKIEEIEDDAIGTFIDLTESIEEIYNLLGHCAAGKLKLSECLNEISEIAQEMMMTCDDDDDELFQMMFEHLMEEFEEAPLKASRGKRKRKKS